MEKELVRDTISLELLHMTHIESYLAMFSPIVQSSLYVSSIDEERKYLMHYLTNPTGTFYCIKYSEPNSLIGAIHIRNLSCARGQLYCWINEKFWGKGLFKKAIKKASQNYFEKTKQLFFNSYVDTTNKRSYYALKKSGFADIGFVNGPRGKQYELILRNKKLLF